MDGEIRARFGDITVTMSLADAEAIKSFVTDATLPAGASDLARAMPADFDHCKRRGAS